VIAIDSAGNPYIIFIKYSLNPNDSVYFLFSSKTTGIWQSETLGIATNWYTNHDLAIDSFHHPCIAYSLPTSPYHLIFAYKDNQGWHKDTAGIVSVPPWGLSLAIDVYSFPMLVTDDNGQGIFISLGTDSIWHREVFDPTYVDKPSIDVDQFNQPHISYLYGDEDLWYARKVDTVWYCRLVDDIFSLAIGGRTSLRVGPHGVIGIAYKGGYENGYPYPIQYAELQETLWIIEFPDTLNEGGVCSSKSLDFNSQDNPYIANYNVLHYKSIEGWQTETIPDVVSLYSLRIDRNDIIHIVASNNLGVWYIYGTPEGIEEGDRLRAKGERLELGVLPNIVRDNTRIQYSIPEKQEISLNLYDIAGRRITAIAKTILEPGIYSYNFNTTGLSHGIYFLVLEGKRDSQKQKILVIR